MNKKIDKSLSSIKNLPTDSTNRSLLFYSSILDEICQEEKINFSTVSSGWVRVLEKNGDRRFIVGYKFGLNSAAAGLIADDKFATFEVLQAEQIPAIPHHIFYESTNSAKFAREKNSLEYVASLLEKYGEIVIKPNNGTKGEGIVRAKCISEVKEGLPEIFHQSYSASVCPFYQIEREYRVVMLDGQAQLVYAKEKGGDWRFNLEHGAQAKLLDDRRLEAELVQVAKRVVRAIGLRFCSVDIIETREKERMVMEVNSGVMIRRFLRQHPEQREKVKEIYRRAILKMFAEV